MASGGNVGETPDERRRNSLDYSVKDGIACSAMTGFGEQYLLPLGVELSASNLQMGLLASVPAFVAALSQLYTSKAVDYFNSRKKTITTFVFLQALIWLPLAALAVSPCPDKPLMLIILAVLYFSFGQFITPAWNSFMGDLVDERVRGRFFGFRNKMTGASAFASMLAAGFVLGLFPEGGVLYGFAFIFLAAFASRLVSWGYLKKMYQPKREDVRQPEFSFRQYFNRLSRTNYGKFALYFALMNLSVSVAGPFFTVYMLKDLGFSYIDYTLVTAAAALTTFLAMTYWGNVADRFGNKRILAFCGASLMLVPWMWLFSREVWFLVLAQITAGFVWAGFNLSSSNFIYDNVKPENRTKIFAYHNVLNGSSIFAGALMGGILASVLSDPWIFYSKLQTLFLLSGLMRGAASFYFLPKIREVRDVENITSREFFLKFSGIGPAKGISYRTVHFIRKSVEEVEKVPYIGQYLPKKRR